MGRRVKSKSNLVIHEVEGTSLRLKVTSNLETKIKKGTASLNTLAKKLAQENKLALQGLFKNPEKEFKRLAGFSTDSKNFLQRITTAYRSALYSVVFPSAAVPNTHTPCFFRSFSSAGMLGTRATGI